MNLATPERRSRAELVASMTAANITVLLSYNATQQPRRVGSWQATPWLLRQPVVQRMLTAPPTMRRQAP
jgi:hypothetical protein